ncbi:MAG TPA: hypothetical protein PLS49_04410 [Candidatus Woesebacteria bacterium]|nr:hypothetical protein [Candidatus Woesebacteria bacterium]
MTEKITGYSLLATGIIIMLFATIQIILVFTGKAKPIELFQYEKPQQTLSSELDLNSLLTQLQAGQTNNAGSLPSLPFLDSETINRSLNLIVYYLIMQFLLGLGYKFASLGTQLIRPINVILKNRTLEEEKTPPVQI